LTSDENVKELDRENLRALTRNTKRKGFQTAGHLRLVRPHEAAPTSIMGLRSEAARMTKSEHPWRRGYKGIEDPAFNEPRRQKE
jgi:hypothetical protein